MDGFREVSKEEFYARIGPMNVAPTTIHPDRTLWELPNRALVGVTWPGWKNPGDPPRYTIREGAARRP